MTKLERAIKKATENNTVVLMRKSNGKGYTFSVVSELGIIKEFITRMYMDYNWKKMEEWKKNNKFMYL